MTGIGILPVSDKDGVTYRAVSDGQQSEGRTPGEALDALAAQLPEDSTTVVVLQRWLPDQFFTAAQQQRLGELMTRWRGAQEAGLPLSLEEQAELDALIEAELIASAERCAAIADTLGLGAER